MRFALMQVKTGLCHILSRFEGAPCKGTPLRIVFEPKAFLLQMHGEIRLSFNRMQFWNNIYIQSDKIESLLPMITIQNNYMYCSNRCPSVSWSFLTRWIVFSKNVFSIARSTFRMDSVMFLNNFACFCTVIIRCTGTLWSPCVYI
jgi:hypothetical protein